MIRNSLQFGFLFLFALLISGCATTSVSGDLHPRYDFSQIERVAVVAIEGAGGNEVAQNQIGMMFNQVLMRKGYSPVERSQIRSIMDEQDFQQTDVTTAHGAAQLGRILNVDAALIANVPEYTDKMSISVQMVDVEDASILWSASGSGAVRGGLTEQVGQFAGALGGAGAGSEAGGTTGAVLGGVAGAFGGGLAGKALTPQQQEHAAKLIEEIGETLADATYR